MDVLGNSLGLVCICFGLLMSIFSFSRFLKERKKMGILGGPDQRRPHWYTNANLRKHIELFGFGVLLSGAALTLILLLHHVASALLCASLIFFLLSFSWLVHILVEETGQRRRVQETGGTLLHWSHNILFHQEVATALFGFSLSLTAFLNGLVAIKVLSFAFIDQFSWLWGGFVLASALYWILAWVIRKIQMCRSEK